MKDIFDNSALRIFRELSRIPRESGNEKAVSDWIKRWAEEKDLKVRQDDLWNLIICKPASSGYEDHDPVILQAHIDMVCEKDSDSDHDFLKDPIELVFDGEWISAANGTTLGADNGIGVAAAMALLEDPKLEAPPLEVVFTVQEETTFAGAENVDVRDLKASRMINLDHADEHELIVGSCGGTGVELTMPIKRESEIPEGYSSFRIKLSGLQGGHSGEDIHRGRGNAISLMMRFLDDPTLRTISICGGTNRLAIPREAEAEVLAPGEDELNNIIAEAKMTFAREYSGSAPELDITAEKTETKEPPLSAGSFEKVVALVRLYPNGIAQMSGSFQGLVESSDNIGIFDTEKDKIRLVSEVRGAYQSTVDDIVLTIKALAKMLGAEINFFNAYVPWEFEAKSHLRELATNTYREMFGEEMRELALHAGLECGFFAEKKPGIDLISIGPDCQYFHSPKERVRAESVEHFDAFLRELLRKL